MTKNSLCSWSGGKDSCFALMQAINLGYVPKVLLNVLNEEGKISRSHGIPYSILQEQANRAGLHLHCISSSWAEYEMHFTNALKELKDGFQLTMLCLEILICRLIATGKKRFVRMRVLTAVLPLWKQDRRALVMQMLEAGIETMIVSCNEIMGERFIGKLITPSLIDELELLGIDACGENGEYHTLVLDCPLFSSRINVSVEEKVKHEGYWFGRLR